MTTQAIIGRVNRLKVFSYVKKVMTEEGRCPTGQEIGDYVDISRYCANDHLLALSKASGLPLPVQSKRIRISNNKYGTYNEYQSQITALMHRNRGYHFDENAIPVDELFT